MSNVAAIVPAAGHSLRMGRPKLTLPIGDSTVIARVVHALRLGGVDTIVVVNAPIDSPGAEILRREAENAGATVLVTQSRPLDMRGSVEHALDFLESGQAFGRIMLTPADSPGLTPRIVETVLKASELDPDAIVTAVFEGRRGHPVVFPRPVALAIRELPMGVGIPSLLSLRAERFVAVEIGDPSILDDLDTPDDYDHWNQRLTNRTESVRPSPSQAEEGGR